MNIQLLSDLHLEAHPHFQPEPAPGADVLVLAGDIGSYQAGSLLSEDDFGLARFSPLPRSAGGADWPVPVLFVPGNHEYDAQDFDAAHLRLQAACTRWGITWLERATVVLQGVRFVGTTLWSDFDALAIERGTTDPTRLLALRCTGFNNVDLAAARAQDVIDRVIAVDIAVQGGRGGAARELDPFGAAVVLGDGGQGQGGGSLRFRPCRWRGGRCRRG